MAAHFQNLASRLGTAAVALPILIATLFLAPRWAGAGLIAMACVMALHELYSMLQTRGIRPLSLAGLLALALSFIEVARPLSVPAVIPIVLVVTLGLALTRGGAIPDSVTAAALSLLSGLYLGALGGCMAALLLIEPVGPGPWRVVFLMATIMISDTAAYFAGHVWGRQKLAPRISPGKTVQGGVGALVGGVACALAVRALAFPEMPAWHAALLGVGVSVAGLLGDLAESLMKRWAGVKDSGALFPGHGGMLDRLDSLLFGAPVLYYYFLYVR